MNKTLVSATGIAGASLFVFSAILGGFQLPNYSHISQFISESYAIGTPYGKLLRYFGYIPSGIFLTIFAFGAANYFPKSNSIKIGFWGLGIFYGLATIMTSIFPCDQGCNKEMIDPSLSQLIHNLTGLFTYLFVPISLLLIGYGLGQYDKKTNFSKITIGAGLICILLVVVLLGNPLTIYAGLLQRLIEGTILLWIVFCSIQLKNQKYETKGFSKAMV
ncbi:DUF998 domain-containing protein [Mangrovivirga sp. M17]|uniref:DUF998 domain-containing protein n=1 Tax=Mangrovivirga halotolerans TaxID=2993936 RepID=A0ABT3RNZ2_9BACT|nr:DUF998 domain-containing protein [Mangrovivirga halotolerans]MCX2743326.1 DUF998 domain-containing protein [Mangrovivirga halotolerans]